MEKLTFKVGEVLRLLGDYELTPNQSLLNLIDEASELIHSSTRLRSYYRRISRAELAPWLSGESINEHVGDAQELIILACTLGNQVDFEIRRIQQYDMSFALVVDAVASVYVETFADQVELALRDHFLEHDLYLSTRFAPGYGDLPLETIPSLLKALQEPQLPIHYNHNSLMTPLKSIVAILALGTTRKIPYSDPCSRCLLQGKCALKTRGGYCGKFSENAF